MVADVCLFGFWDASRLALNSWSSWLGPQVLDFQAQIHCLSFVSFWLSFSSLQKKPTAMEPMGLHRAKPWGNSFSQHLETTEPKMNSKFLPGHLGVVTYFVSWDLNTGILLSPTKKFSAFTKDRNIWMVSAKEYTSRAISASLLGQLNSEPLQEMHSPKSASASGPWECRNWDMLHREIG